MVGRYVITGRLGAGGMSVVYAAHDPELDRKVAVKVMRTEFWDEEGRLRLLREAQAMAKLAHPNVVAIYDVGTTGDQLFIAMELIEGLTLGSWMDAETRSWRQVLDVLVQVGRGLAAAHAAGLVHRDVKPSNVLVDGAGRARIGDFGIARAVDASVPAPEAAPVPEARNALESSSARHLLSKTFTRVGAVVGTPLYMAPEQREGHADERSDLYGFCRVALEVLVPAAGNQVRAARGTPAWLIEVVQRGLAFEPAARPPSMEALLAALTHDPTASRRRALGIASVVALLAAVILGVGWYGQRAARVCRGAEEKLTGVWDPAVRQAIAQAFSSTRRPHAGTTFSRVEQQLDARASAWVRMRTEACEATHGGEQSAALLDLRMQCLDQRLAETRALTGMFATQADAEVVDRAVHAVAGLADLSRCADAEALGAAYPPLRDPARRAQVAALRQRLGEARALRAGGSYARALTQAKAVSEEATKLAWPPLEAEALLLLGDLQGVTGDTKASEATLAQAAQRGADARDDALVAEAGSELIDLVGYEGSRPKEALALAVLVEAMVRRAGDQPSLRSRYLDRVGGVLWSKGEPALALGYFERALPLAVTAYGEGSPLLAPIYNSLGNVLADLGRNDEARRRYEQALAVAERAQGPDHPDVARMLSNLGMLEVSQRRYQEARTHLERARRILEPAFGPQHSRVGVVTNNLGELELGLHHHAEARAHFERALAIFERSSGSEHGFVAYPTGNLGKLALAEGHPALARQFCQRALDVTVASGEGKSTNAAGHLVCLGEALLAERKPADALPHLERAVALREATAGDPADLAHARATLARARQALGHR